MPGNKIYRISRAFDLIQNWWYFGSIAQIKYHLKLSDKYLVEAKTLFEYKQYLLGHDALKRSDDQFLLISSHIDNGIKEGKDMSLWKQLFVDAGKIHSDILNNLILVLPRQFEWVPEKALPSTLQLHEALIRSIDMRKPQTLMGEAFK
jgi:hypothetical protein